MPRAKWTPEMEEAMRRRYPVEPTDTLAASLGMSVPQVYRKAEHLGLTKTREYIAAQTMARLNITLAAGMNTRFGPGQEPWNKGKAYSAGGRSIETRFKPGHKPPSTQPVGATKTDKDGNLLLKVAETGHRHTDWIAVHRKAWEDANGPTPPGHIVVFKPGCRTAVLEHITADKVECISRGENMRRNTVHRLPKELAEIIQLQGALRRQINKRTKKT
jgi:hypothetical protein